MVVQAFDPSTQEEEAEARRSACSRLASQDYLSEILSQKMLVHSN